MWRAQRTPPAPPQANTWEFLPAILEIQDNPPSPIGHAILWTIVVMLTTTLLWASLSTVDIVAVAQGKIIPHDYSKVIQPLESGVITAIHVKNGQEVKQGDLLLALDTTASGADRDRLLHEHHAVRAEIARLRAVLSGKNTLEPLAGVDPPLLTVQRQLLRDQLAEHRARVASAQWIIEQRQAAMAITTPQIERLKAIIPILEERAEAYRKLYEKTYVSRMQYLGLEQERIEKVKELASYEQKLVHDRAALAEAQLNHQTLVAEFQRSRVAELATAETRAASLAREVVKAKKRTALQQLTAPIDGVVQQLAVHTLGGVVTPAQPLMVIVPRGHLLEVEAWVENQDIGFVHAGQVAEVKVAAFPFTRYGTLSGAIETLSHDAVPQDHGGFAYAARVSLERTAMQVDTALVPLTPGMAVTVEIKTGTRRLLEYFLSPLLQAGQESVRER